MESLLNKLVEDFEILVSLLHFVVVGVVFEFNLQYEESLGFLVFNDNLI